MQIEIDGLHDLALNRLMKRNNEKTAAAMVRILIRDAAKEIGDWPMENEAEIQLIRREARQRGIDAMVLDGEPTQVEVTEVVTTEQN